MYSDSEVSLINFDNVIFIARRADDEILILRDFVFLRLERKFQTNLEVPSSTIKIWV